MTDHLTCSHPEVHADTLWQENRRLRQIVGAQAEEIVDWERRLTEALDVQLGLREAVEAARKYRAAWWADDGSTESTAGNEFDALLARLDAADVPAAKDESE